MKRNDSIIYSKPPTEMTEEERLAAISELEGERRALVAEIELLMEAAARSSGIKRYKRRKYKLGKSPNDL